MMTAVEIRQTLAVLRLSQQEAATLLGVSGRSVRRWLEGETIPGPVEAALRAWRQLEERGLAWRPDSVTLFQEDERLIAVYRQEAMKLDSLLERVGARGGPRLPWNVDIAAGTATMQWATLSFYKLQNGGFSPSTYRRSDQSSPPDLERDRDLIEDGLYCIAAEFQKIGRRVRALRAVAQDIRANTSHAGTRGPVMLSDVEKELRKRTIEGLAARIDLLADQTEAGDKTNYPQFEKLRQALADQGLWANRALISEVARSFFEGRPTVRLSFLRAGRLDNAVTWSKDFDPGKAEDLIAGHPLKFMGPKLRPINESSHEVSNPQFVVLHVPLGVEFAGAPEPGYYVVADLRPSQVSITHSCAV